MTEPTKKRRVKLIDRKLQLRLIGLFLGINLLTLLMQVILLSERMNALAASIQSVGQELVDHSPRLILEVVLMSFAFTVPFVLLVGVQITFKVAGPAYRIRKYLEEVVAGRANRPCRLRKGDYLQELCDAVNQATETLRVNDSTADANREEAA